MLLAGCGGGGSGALPPAAGGAIAPPVDGRPALTTGVSTGPYVAQTALAGTNGNASSLSASFTTAPQAGSYLVAFLAAGDTTTVTTAPSGWSAAKDGAGHACAQMSGPAGSQGEQVFVHRVAAGETAASYAFAFKVASASSYALSVLEVRNVNASTPIDACAGAEAPKSSSTGSVAAATLTATNAGDVPLVGYAPSTSGLTVTPKSGWNSALYNNTQTPYMTLDVEAGPALAAGASVQPATTFGKVSGSIVYAPTVALLLVAAPPPATPAPILAPPAAGGVNVGGVNVVQTARAGSNGNATSLSATLTSAPHAGDLLAAFIGNGDGTTVTTPPSGWSAASDTAGHACRQNTGVAGSQGEQVFVHRVGAGEGAGPYTFAFASASGSPYAIGLLELSGVSASAPIDACAATQPAKSSSNGPVAAATLTASNTGDLPVVGYAPSTSGLSVSPANGWTSTLYNNTQTPYLSLDVESGPALNAGSSKTPSTTFGNLGGSPIVYAPSVGVLFAPDTAISPVQPTAAPTIAPTVAPTPLPPTVPSLPIPTPQPTAAPVGALPAFVNGTDYPASWRPYAAGSVWNSPVPASPKLWSQSAAVIAQQFNATGTSQMIVREDEAGPYDYGHPIYFASSSDPVVSISCHTYCDKSDNGGLPATIHVPAKARPAGGQDSHMAVIQPDMTEVDFFGVTKPSGNWGTSGNTTITAGSVMNCGSFVNGQGFAPNGAVTVGGACLGAGIVRPSELSAGRINHALFLVVNCASSASQNEYPVLNGAGTDVCTNYPAHAAPPLGARMWLDLTDAQIAALPAQPWEKAIMYALHDYGGYIEDDVAGGSDIAGVFFKYEGGDMPYAFGQSDPYGQIPGWYSIGTPSGSLAPRYMGAEPWAPAGADFASHMHYVDPCVTQKTC